MALEEAVNESVELRRGLPTDLLSYMGLIHSGTKDKRVIEKREAFQRKMKELATGILSQSCDYAVDQLGKKFVWDSLPPYLTSKAITNNSFPYCYLISYAHSKLTSLT